ncbi:type 1 glutamine amidotransferase [Blastopirellula sp. JC732]|uniref:Type 1 glutamine amidotransferase n=1 Tax=Blastopirellula sediminis TaxID=2894196 RepID=A0A9X1SIZ0_9BACT|nr:type 1 glutamine amidotransferase [Blastopirellula sediminis]MCC9604918.1 type 1 glutamine amidotransferase [Blastopirellula sediminis]MCC9631782.1 type 1 glutamine amidotransferase [Blastopirellula sediminis]
MTKRLRYLLIQIRNADDPIRGQEIGCFARALECHPSQIEPFDLLSGAPSERHLAEIDMVMIGGSGHYSVASDGEWLHAAMAGLRKIVELEVPMFGSCWGFQALARALGGRVIHDLEHAELGTHELFLTDAGRADPIFGTLSQRFPAYMGHEDRVIELPPGVDLLASSDLVPQQAFRVHNKPIYCTQFHPELTVPALLERVRAYPEYCAKIAGIPYYEFEASFTAAATETEGLLLAFQREFLGA